MTDSSPKKEQATNALLKARIEELEDTIHAIQSGGVDSLVISTDSGDKVFTLENADQQYRLFVENMSEGAFTFTEEGIILYCNRAFSAIFHLSPEQIIGHNINEYSPERQPDGCLSIKKAQEKIAAALAGETQLFEWVHLRSDGTTFDAEVMINRILLKDDYCLQAIIRDITERKRSVDALALANRKINLLLSITRHDINNQLSSVNGFLTLLHRKVPDPSLENYFTRITKASSLISAHDPVHKGLRGDWRPGPRLAGLPETR